MNFAYLKNGFSRLEPLDADEQELDLFRQRLGSTEARVVLSISTKQPQCYIDSMHRTTARDRQERCFQPLSSLAWYGLRNTCRIKFHRLCKFQFLYFCCAPSWTLIAIIFHFCDCDAAAALKLWWLMVQQNDWFSTIDKTWKCYKRLFLKRSKDKWIERKFYGKTEKRSDALKYYGCGKQGSRALLQDTALPTLGYYTICDHTWNACSMKRPLLDGWQVFDGEKSDIFITSDIYVVLFNILRFSLHHCTGALVQV